jgi:Ca2+-binding RTX toxin-like protein
MMSSEFSKLVLVDPTVSNYERLVAHTKPGTRVVILDAETDGVTQITQALADDSLNQSAIKTLHIVSHGSAGELRLGSAQLNSATLPHYTAQMQQWAEGLAPDAEILLYGCDVARQPEFVEELRAVTGRAIAASSNLTGSTDLGGDWELDYRTDEMTASLAFEPEALAMYEGVLAATDLVTEDFADADVDPVWLFGVGEQGSANPFLTARPTTAPITGGLPGAPTGFTPDAAGQGALRLTNNSNNQSSFVLYNGAAQPANEGISVLFDFYSYGGTGGDGISFFLIDGNANPTQAGAFGGSLGYAQKTTPVRAGLTGGVLGIGFDEYGNFAAGTEGRVGGQSDRVPDSVTVRGSGSTYPFISTTGTLGGSGIDTPGAGVTRQQAQRRAKIDITPEGRLTVKVDLNGDKDFLDNGEVSVDNLNLAANGVTLPNSFKFGFASSTGVATNFHELNNVVVRNLKSGISAFAPDGKDLGQTLVTREGDAPLQLGFSLDRQPTANVTVTLALAGEDPDEGTIQPTTLTFTPQNWDSRQTVTLAPQDDTELDGDRKYVINYTSTSTDTSYNFSSTKLLDVTNRDNETAPPPSPAISGLTIAPSSLPENSTTGAVVTATLASAAPTDVTLTLGYGGTAAASDYTAPTTIRIARGQTSGTATIQPTDDTVFEGDETVTVGVTQATGATPTPGQSASLTIVDNDAPPTVSLSAVGTPLAENGGVATFTATLSSATTSPVTVGLDFTGTAANGTDYAPSANTITIPAGSTAGSITVTSAPDTLVEGDETIIAGLGTVTGATAGTPNSATATISDGTTPPANRLPVFTTPSGLGASPGQTIPVTGLSATDPDGLIVSYTITQLPDPSQGTLFLSGGIPVQLNQQIGPDQIGQLTFQAAPSFQGDTRFTVTATDNQGGSASTIVPLRFIAGDGGDGGICGPGRTIRGTSGRDRRNGTGGTDRMFGGNGGDTLRGRNCNDRVEGGSGNDRLFGDNGEDNLRGGSGSDFLSGGNGQDNLAGNAGNDRARGGTGNDLVQGNQGRDRLFGDSGNDRLNGGSGSDLVNGGVGDDRVNGASGNDRVRGGGGNDFMLGGVGRDRLSGDGGNDFINAGSGRDFINGGSGDDTLIGRGGNDRIFSGAGDDVIVGALGADRINMRGGRDVAIYRRISERGDRLDRFEVGQDVIDLRQITRGRAFGDAVRLRGSGNGTVVQVDTNGTAGGGFRDLLTVNGIAPSLLTQENFLV